MAFSQSATSAANATAVITIAAVQGQFWRIYTLDAWTSAGTSQITIAEGGTTRWLSPATWVPTTGAVRTWTPQPLQANTSGTALTITASAAGGGNTVTLNVQLDQFA